MVEQDNSIVSSSRQHNHVGILDRALFRRFDDVVQYEMPDQERIVETLKMKLGNFHVQKMNWSRLATQAKGLSYADITRACEDAIKDALIHDLTYVTSEELIHFDCGSQSGRLPTRKINKTADRTAWLSILIFSLRQTQNLSDLQVPDRVRVKE
jgi:AAA+ superfamily predicted ATPase